jgi:uncharacterized membrane-anchored protein
VSYNYYRSMNTCFLRISRCRFPQCSIVAWLFFLTFSLIQPSWGQDQQLSFSSGIQPQNEPDWVSGPAKVSLGAVADLQIPAGYHYLDAEGARSLLQRMNNPVPNGIVGILAPVSGESLAVIAFSDMGYVNDAGKDGMNSKAILKAIQNRNESQNNDILKGSVATAISVDWVSRPVYDPKDHSLEWAIQAETQSGKVINHTVVLLGRRGVLDVTMVNTSQGSSGLIPLKQLVKNISFKEGQTYADYQKSDATAGVSLGDLVVDDENPATSSTKDSPVRAASDPFAWIYFYYYLLGGGVVVLLGLLFIKNLSKRKKHRAVHQHSQHSFGTTSGLALSNNGNGNGNGHGSNGVKLNGLNGHLARRKRAANFGKFYTNMILELSSSNCEEVLSHNWNPATPVPKVPSSPNAFPSDPAIVTANLELITIQKNLIEEQRRFILEQSKFIEEKRQLIEAQNRMVERQSEGIGNQFSLKLDE